jgi:hypothetical protein
MDNEIRPPGEGVNGTRPYTEPHYPTPGGGDGQFRMAPNGKPKVMPGHFDGTGCWPDYIVHFEVCAQLNGWDQANKAAYLAVSLRGLAQQLLGDLTSYTRASYSELKTALG